MSQSQMDSVRQSWLAETESALVQLRAEICDAANGRSLVGSEVDHLANVEVCLGKIRDALRLSREPGHDPCFILSETKEAAEQLKRELDSLRQRRQLASIAFDQPASLAPAAFRRPLS